MVKPAIRKETSAKSAGIWLCEEYNEIKTFKTYKKFANVLSV